MEKLVDIFNHALYMMLCFCILGIVLLSFERIEEYLEGKK